MDKLSLITILEQFDSKKKYYHGSKNFLKTGATYVALNNRKTLGRLEDVIERFRPKPYASRFKSFFMTRKSSSIDTMGGSSTYIYIVIPKSKVFHYNFGWIDLMIDWLKKQKINYRSFNFDKLNSEQKRRIKQYIKNYFSGKQSKKLVDLYNEYLTERVEIVKISKSSYKYDEYVKKMSKIK